ncbi:MAG TPA: serine hydrolase domain-containing protein, partial [Thermomicrobiales bacterium]|nr:serine hydrolase domain-containing protein [Thermomicrobiales bacterium]
MATLDVHFRVGPFPHDPEGPIMNCDSLAAAIKQICDYAKAEATRFEMPGLQIALTDREVLLGTINLGFANLDAKTPVTDATLFEFGSIGKSFTAICLLQLADEGKIDLHAPFDSQLPWWSIKSQFAPITAHDLMSHTAGIISGTDFTPEQRFEVWALRNTETFAAPGTTFHYSNVGYKSLGLLIEHVTGKPYGDVVRERILEPLGMGNTLAAITQADRHRLALGYQDYYDDRPRAPGRGVVPAPWLETDSGDGCLSASASDLAIYLRMFMNHGAYPGGRVLTDAQFAIMTTPRIVMDPDDNLAYGYGITIPAEGTPGHFGHGGGMVGYISEMRADLTTGFGAIAFTNSMNNVSQIAEYALDVLRAADANEPLPSLPGQKADAFATHAGTYVGRTGEIEIKVNGTAYSLIRDGEEIPLTATA